MRTANHLARGKKVPKWKGFCLVDGEPFPVAFPGKRGIFSFFFVVKPTVISPLQWGETKKGEEEKGKKKREALCGT